MEGQNLFKIIMILSISQLIKSDGIYYIQSILII